MKLFSLSVLVFLAACGSANAPEVSPATSTPETTSNSATSPMPESANGVAFKVNGAAANTTAKEEPNAQLNSFDGTLNIYVYGDEPSMPYRGFLTLTLRSYHSQTGSFGCKAKFVRYAKANGAGSIVYEASDFELKIKENTRQGNEKLKNALISGSFSGKLKLSKTTANPSDVKEIDISEGKFQNLPFTVLGNY